eukprot:TRINITY_DN77627_c0_g1_i1.p1 TRINITY_DN77627_c0_g1~~TRINITY_DN77627_c0_g1_i1.p1  ORF type:complete len:567 (+),score=81.50 TRINITY_DN77627_c0_g1_i1:170-1870(+)
MMDSGYPIRSAMEIEIGSEAIIFLGVGGTFDLLESSSWPFVSLDIYLNTLRYIGGESEFVLYQRPELLHGDLVPPSKLLGFNFMPRFANSLSLGFYVTDTVHAGVMNHAESLESYGSPRNAKVVAFGGHGSLPMEPTASLAAALESSVIFTFTYIHSDCTEHGTNQHNCRLIKDLQGREENRPTGELSNAMLDMIAQSQQEGQVPSKSYSQNVLRAAYEQQREVHNADFWVCTESAFWCTVLFAGLPEGTHMIIYTPHCWHTGLKSLQKDDDGQQRMYDWMRLFLSETRGVQVGSSSNPEPRISFASAYPLLSVQMLYLFGKRFPTVRPLALYIQAKYTPQRNSVVLPRTKLFTKYGLITGFVIMKMLDFIASANNLSPRFELLEYARYENRFVDFETIASCRAAVLIPQVEHVMVFEELHAIGMPIMMPSPEWLARLIQNSPSHALSLYPPALPRFGQLPEVQLETEWALLGFEHKPFTEWAQFLSIFEFVYWQGFTNYASAPHVLGFDSVPELLFQIAHLDVSSVHGSMQEVNALWRRQGLDYWRRAAGRHLSQAGVGLQATSP